MPFKRGFAPIRRTIKYLESSPIIFRERVKVMTIHYNEPQELVTSKKEFPQHEGAKDFAIWTLPQIQYKNPNVQITTFLNQTPSPYITCYLDGGTKVLFDVDGQTKEEIIERIYKTLGKSKKKLQAEELAAQKKDNPANFGRHNDRYCLCSEPGQVPCPSFIPLPKVWRGKFVNENMED